MVFKNCVQNPNKGEQNEYIGRLPHFVTPESETTCHYWFFHTRQFAQEDTDFTTKMERTLEDGFKEDEVAVRHMQNLLMRDQTPFEEINFSGDKPTIAMRKIVQKLVDNEYPSPE